MQMTKIERPALGLLSLVALRGALAKRPSNLTATRTGAYGTKAYQASRFIAGANALCVVSINQHEAKPAAKHDSRFNGADWKHSIRRSRKPRVANG
ncbi:MAG: hypothetical protein P4L91_02670 [Burkholderiaceae bacterium]|nr:hypothetical protein [Burkholderiaceae bacterium]